MKFFPLFFSFFLLGFFSISSSPLVLVGVEFFFELVRCRKYQWLHESFQNWWILSNVRGENLARGRITDDCS